MKRIIFLAICATCIISSVLIQSCDPLEPSTYSQFFFRIATVKIQDNKASLYTDYLHESFFPKNLKTAEDVYNLRLADKQHIIAVLTVDAVGSMDNNSITLNAISRLDTTNCVLHKPSDTLNYYYYFTKYDFDRMVSDSVYPSYIYPKIWAEGHIVNISPTYFVPTEKDKAEFYVYPFDVRSDTLMLRLYSDIPNCDLNLYPDIYYQTLLSIDISSVRDSADNPVDQVVRDTIWSRLDRLNQDRITVTIVTPDSLRAKYKKGTFNQPQHNLSVSINIPFDF
jgi:hypothetical protein